MALLIKNASEILTMKDGIGLIKDCSVLIEEETISEVGMIKHAKKVPTIDAERCIVLPGFVDSHTHLVFAGTREDEFVMRISGTSYEKIAKAGGGIFSTVKKTRAATEDELYGLAMKRLANIITKGTTTIEIKSGYGLSVSEELKILRVIERLKQDCPIEIIPTLLIHTIPEPMKRRDYVDLVIEEVIPYVAKENLAVFCDIFCDKTAFTKKESEKILRKAKELNFKLKIHADELSNSGGASLAAKLGCISADHLIHTTKGTIKAMKKAGVTPTLLPGTSFYLQMKQKPNIKAFNKTKSSVAIASDFNPGTCMINSMLTIIGLACFMYNMSVENALLGATKNGARALDLFDKIGTIEKGKQADLIVLKLDHYKKIPYYFGEQTVKYTIKKGRIIYGENC